MNRRTLLAAMALAGAAGSPVAAKACPAAVEGLYYETYKDGTEWRWRLKAANNKIMASGESYHNRADAERAIELVKGSYAAEVIEEQ